MEMVVGHVVAVLAAWSLAQVVVWRLGGESGWGMGWMAMIGGVLGAYALDRLVDAGPSRRRGFVGACVVVMCAGGLLVAAGMVCVPRIWPVVAALSVVAGAYVRLKRWAPKGFLVAGAWGVACVWLPCERVIGVAEGAPIAACVALVVLANVVLCDTSDVETDRRNGVRGVGPWLGAKRAALVAAAVALLGSVVSVACGVWPLACASGALALMGAWWSERRSEPPRHGRLAADAVMVLPGAAVCVSQLLGAR